MKFCNRSFVGSVALILLSMVCLVANSAGASKRLNYPYGLAVAANGNLYVANSSDNNILVYSPSYTQLTAKTITKGTATPTGLAFDADGNLWVANSASNSVTEYSASGVQNTSRTITTGISNPGALAFDGIADLWVQNSFSQISVYPQFQTQPLVSFGSPSGIVTGLAAYRSFIVTGNNDAATADQIAHVLASPSLGVGGIPATCFAAAFDPAGILYCGNNDSTLTQLDTI